MLVAMCISVVLMYMGKRHELTKPAKVRVDPQLCAFLAP